MKPGDVVLARLPLIVGGPIKLRPALLLVSLPGPYQIALLCGISTRLHNIVPGWDELIKPGDADFVSSKLLKTSVIRLAYLRGVTATEMVGLIGHIDQARLDRLRQHLSDHLRP